ncbi:MAG: hypothetical protein A2Y82_04020 [Candidatus Buchananbacteria bacterium RBG_13_36_9]|uniref:LamG domain-containing protein n=1 Tax=Candidatus Buchananbacteria bacterium RBG_13_36_9 TaxID=1797530 RepID=A0A1G1XSA8_9BACT|nr:MAG: hypothetical protein A2Y82_04020 [Candidatus Buchananbacteria bacterium RBG_13_36_9]
MFKIKYFFLIIFCCFIILVACHQVLALDVGLEYGGQVGLGTKDIRVTIAEIIRTIMGILGLVILILLFISGLEYMLSKDEPEKKAKALKIFASALIGLAIVVLAYAISTFIINLLLEPTGPQEGGGPAGPANNENIDNNNIEEPEIPSCTGLIPNNAIACPSPNATALTESTPNTLVESCSLDPSKCEYFCPTDYNIYRGNCELGDPMLPKNYAAFYSFTTGANDLSGNHYDGIVYKDDLTPDPSAISDGNLNLDGSHFVRVENYSMDPSFTVIARVKSATPTWNTYGWIISSREANGFIIHPWTAGNPFGGTGREWGGHIFDSSGSVYRKIITAPDIMSWHTYGVSYDSSNNQVKIIFDNKVVDSAIFPGLIRTSSNIMIDIGHDILTPTERFGKGQIDWVYIYNYAVY